MAKRRSRAGRRLYAMGRRGAGLKGTAIEAVVGAITGFIAGKAAENIGMLRKAWYVTPLVVITGGHLLKAKNREIGAPVIGAGGAMAYFNYQLNKASQAASGGTAGVQDTGDAVDDYVGMFHSLPDTGAVMEARQARSSVMGL